VRPVRRHTNCCALMALRLPAAKVGHPKSPLMLKLVNQGKTIAASLTRKINFWKEYSACKFNLPGPRRPLASVSWNPFHSRRMAKMPALDQLLLLIENNSWQDVALCLGNGFFCFTLVPMLRHNARPLC
jgi:hypothetical protein